MKKNANAPENYISRQISVYKTDKKLIELIDKLNIAPLEYYAHMHAQGDEVDDGSRRIYSNIGITMLDYTAGKGDATRSAEANLSPEQVKYIFSRCKNGVEKFDFQTDKIFGLPDENGRSRVVKTVIRRANIGSDGKPRRYPWYIEVENGTGIPEKTAIGGTYCQKNSFHSQTKIFINMSDLDFFTLFSRADSYITMFELSNCPALFRVAKQQIAENLAKAAELN